MGDFELIGGGGGGIRRPPLQFLGEVSQIKLYMNLYLNHDLVNTKYHFKQSLLAWKYFIYITTAEFLSSDLSRFDFGFFINKFVNIFIYVLLN